MFKRYPSLQSMQAFLQAARAGSFSSAARQLELSHSAVSQQVRTLEEFVGQSLFVRDGGRIALTDAGQLFVSMLSEGFEQIDRALSSVRERRTERPLTIDVDPELSQGWLASRLSTLRARLRDVLPGRDVVLLSTPRAEHTPFDRVDVALRYGYGEWGDCDSALLCRDRVIAVAAPALLARFAWTAPLSPACVLELPLLGYTRRSWILWLAAAGLPMLEPRAEMTFDNAANLLAAAIDGAGAGLARGLLAADALHAGRLIDLTGVAIPTQYNLYAVWRRDVAGPARHVTDAIRQLIDVTPSMTTV